MEAEAVVVSFSLPGLSQRVDGGRMCRLDGPLMRLGQGRMDMLRNTTRQRAIVQKTRKAMRQLMQGRAKSSTAGQRAESSWMMGEDQRQRG